MMQTKIKHARKPRFIQKRADPAIDGPVQRTDDTEICPIMAQRLFQAIIAQATVDATQVIDESLVDKIKPPIRRSNYTDEDYEKKCAAARGNFLRKLTRHRDEARAFLTESEPYFQLVCEMAGYNPQDVLERACHLRDRDWHDARPPFTRATNRHAQRKVKHA